MIEMLKRHEIQVLRRAGHTWDQVAVLTGVSVGTARRVAAEAGDVFIQGGFPGHAVLVADVAEDAGGRRVFLLLQSFMPAQDVHVLANPTSPGTPWYPALANGDFDTPEWRFSRSDLRRFPRTDCVEAVR